MLPAKDNIPSDLALSVPLPRPVHGSASRVQLGRAELVLECRQGSHSLLWSDGRDARRYVLGLNNSGQLRIELRAPRVPVHVVPRELLTIVPGARLRGFITVPLVPTIVWFDGEREPQTLVELHSPGLQGQWDEATGHVMRCAATWMVRFPFQTGEPQVVVPLRLHNQTNEPACPGHLELRFTDNDLIELRGSVLLRPSRLHWSGSKMQEHAE